MSTPYLWRKLSDAQREELLRWRKARSNPWHTPPHRVDPGLRSYHITAACYNHAHIIGTTPTRLDQFSNELLPVLSDHGDVRAWCVLPNHYHALIQSERVPKLLFEVGRLHGRLARAWNLEDSAVGRHVFHSVVERTMRTERHDFATLNYIHNNPVHHGYVTRWDEWPWSSASVYLASVGREEALRIWREYPVRDYGKDWDAPSM